MTRPAPKPSPADLIQQEVIANILNQPLGNGTVADLDLPREFVARIADRMTRASFNERYRIVVPASRVQGASPGGGIPSTTGAPRTPSAPDLGKPDDPPIGVRPRPTPNLQIFDHPISPEALSARRSLHESRPVNRAFCPGDDPATFNTPTPLPPRDLADFKPTIANFRLLPDDGTHTPRMLRLQLTRGTDYAAPGDGGSLDMLRHVAAALPETPLLVSVERKHFADASTACEAFAAVRVAPISLIVEDLPVAQWSHDNGKPGLADGKPVTIVPRYASRGEDGSVFVPGESFLHEGLAAAGVPCRRSPLLFQGGNLIAFQSPSRNGARAGARGSTSSSNASQTTNDLTLLLGEAELARNTALGLSRDQVLAAMQAEFGVAHIVVLPAISYHIDLEVSIRRLADGQVIALVNDQPAAVRLILSLGLGALERGGVIPQARVAMLRERLNRGPMNEFLVGAWSDLASLSTRPGHVLESLAPAFAVGDADSGVGNIHRYLLALDLLASEFPVPSNIDPHAASVLTSYARREVDRRRLRRQLESLGLKTAGIPSLSDADRGMNYLNGIHTRDALLMPTYGGLFESLDRAAERAIAGAVDSNVRIVAIPSGESQRREGAVRCAIVAIS